MATYRIRLAVLSAMLGLLIVPSARAAVTIRPTTVVDDLSANTCDPGAASRNCSLRNAIAAAQNGDTVSLGPGAYSLSQGELLVSTSISITGAGARSTSIAPAPSSPSRVLVFASGVTATLSGVTITGGDGIGAAGSNGEGGGIANLAGATLTADSISVRNNSVSSPCPDYCGGGGIFNGGTLTLTNSTVSGNSATKTSSGGGAPGGGIYNVDGATTVINSTIVGNHSTSNTGAAWGGGIASRHSGSMLRLSFVTLTDNTAVNTDVAQDPSDAGNLYAFAGAIEANTIIARGSSNDGQANCSLPGGTGSQGNNLEDLNQCGFTHVLGDQINTNPGLGALQNNGGPADTENPLAGSAAIDKANATCVSPGISDVALTHDQRGIPRPQNGRCDVGAVEYVAPPLATGPPRITGAAVEGKTLFASTGMWTGGPALASQWKRCDTAGNGCINIAGATRTMYTLRASDVGHTLRIAVTATNLGGSTTATSDKSPTVRGLPPPVLSKLHLSSRSFRAKQGTTLTFSLSEPATVRMIVYANLSGRKVKRHCKTTAKKGKRCTVPIRRTAFTFAGAKGANSFKLRTAGLTPGRYSATVTARDSAGNSSSPHHLTFAVKKPKKK